MSLALIVVVLLAVALLPSALNVPQSSPNTVPEYAPVPPDEDSETPERSNLAALGTAKGSSLAAGAGPSTISAPTTKKRSGKRCVGNPPRQTEDLMSPPCVAFFEGDNGGTTYQGVTKDEVRAVVTYDGCNGCVYDIGDRQRENTPPGGTYCDVDLPQNTGGQGCYVAGTTRDHTMVKWVRAYSTYFNERYQTYDRRVHFWVYWNSGFNDEGRRAAAADNYATLKPFASLPYVVGAGFLNAYLDAMARRNVLLFEGNVPAARAWEPQPASFYQKYTPQIWGFFPDVEHWVENYSSYVCAKMPPGSLVSHSTGGVGLDGRPFNGSARRFGLIYTTDARYPGVQLFAEKAAAALKSKCGIDPPSEARATYPLHGIECCPPAAGQAATENVAKLKQAGVTTLLWLGGADIPWTSNAADEIKWYPEVVYAADGVIEQTTWGRLQNPNFYRNARMISHQRRQLNLESTAAGEACLGSGQGMTKGNCTIAQGAYNSYFQLFQAIQVAGPRLNPRSIQRGMLAIPRISSTHPDLASCFYETGDHTCVKDVMELWWDPNTPPPGFNQPGCYRMVQAGRRYLADEWTSADEAFQTENSPCSSYTSGTEFETA